MKKTQEKKKMQGDDKTKILFSVSLLEYLVMNI